MIYIEKGLEPLSFSEWKSLANSDWTPTFDSLRNPQKAELIQSLLREQHGICCYCEQSISEKTLHIEHLVPQSVDATKALEYRNMACSCIRNTPQNTNLHCGHKRENWYDSDYISPLEEDCESHFSFSWDGTIRPNDCTDNRAVNMIQHLALNHVVLNEKRKAALDPIIDLQMTKEQMILYAQKVTQQNSNGMYNPGFPSLFRDLIL